MQTLSLSDARRVWAHAQQLTPQLTQQQSPRAAGPGDATAVPGGWMRAIGGADPYVCMWARVDVSVAALGEAVAQDALWVVPGVRNCIWVVPAADVPLALCTSRLLQTRAHARDLAKVDVDDAEMDRVCQAVRAALEDGPLETTKLGELLRADGVVRSLGDAGKKIGLTTTLPPALRALEWAGAIRRRPLDLRLDSNRYTWEPAPAAHAAALTLDDASIATALLTRFLTWAGPSTLDAFVAWSGLGKRLAKAAWAKAALAEVAIDGLEGPHAVLEPDTLAAALDGPRGHARLITGQDNLPTLQGSAAPLVDPAHHDYATLRIGGKTAPLGTTRWLNQRPVVVDGTVVGFWDYDEAKHVVRAGTFDAAGSAVQAAIAAQADALGPRITHELDGVAKSTAIDGAKSRARRLAALDGLHAVS